MKFSKLLSDSGRQRIYELDFNISTIPKWESIEKLELMNTKFKPEWTIDEDVSKSINKICISDAHTHIERLVFPAFWVKNSETGERRVTFITTQIDGCMTFMTHGGDPSSVHEDKVYIRHLRSINKEKK